MSTSIRADKPLSEQSTEEHGVQERQKLRRRPAQQEPLPMIQAPQCGATTRSGNPCQSLPVRGKSRCRMHGGAPGSGAPLGNQNALKHGRYTAEAMAWRRNIRELVREGRRLIEEI